MCRPGGWRTRNRARLERLCNTEAQRMIGLSSDAMEAELGYRGRAEMVHRDDMVLPETKIWKQDNRVKQKWICHWPI